MKPFSLDLCTMHARVQLRVVFWARIASILFVFGVMLLIVHYGYVLFVPLFAAFLAAILLYRINKFFERIRFGLYGSAIFSVLTFLALVAVIFIIINSQLMHFARELPGMEQRISNFLMNIENWISQKFGNETSQTNIQQAYQLMVDIKNAATPTFAGAARMLVLIVLFLFFTFFILVYRNLLRRFILSLFKESQKETADNIIYTVRSLIHGYLNGLLSEMAIVFLLLFAILLLLGIKYALLMAMVGAILNIIPYIGIYTATALGIIITLANGSDYQAAEVGVVFIIVHLIDANILVPYIVGKRVKINPFMALIAIIAGGLVWGIAGMFLFIPLTAILKIIFENTKDLRSWAILIGDENP